MAKKKGALSALGSIYGSGIKAFFRRKRKAAYAADVDARRSEVAKLVVRVGSDVGGTRFRSRFRSKAKRAAMREQATIRASKDIMETLGEMKGLVMKAAQLGSFMMALPEEAETDLASLQADAPPMPAADIVRVLETELGADITSRFRWFDEKPLAAASIGQVHRATLSDGREVVLKVQYPGIEESVIADLAAFEELTRVYALVGDFGPMLENMERTLRSELDYRREADNQQHFADLYAGDARIVVPNVVRELSTKRVLTSDFVSGQRLYDVRNLTQTERDRYGETIYRFAMTSIFQGLFSGDPHPGNYLFLDDGRVCFLDFGFVEHFDDPARDAGRVLALVQAGLRDDRDGIAAALKGLGLLPAKGKSDPQKLWAELRPMLFGPIERSGPVTVDGDYTAATMRTAMSMSSELNKMRKSKDLQPWIGLLMRYAGGTMAVIGKLRATVDWRALMEELVAEHSRRASDVAAVREASV